jgi:hypothetical protein
VSRSINCRVWAISYSFCYGNLDDSVGDTNPGWIHAGSPDTASEFNEWQMRFGMTTTEIAAMVIDSFLSYMRPPHMQRPFVYRPDTPR